MDSHSICPRCLWGGSSKDSGQLWPLDRKSTRLNSSHVLISYAVFCLQKKIQQVNIKTSLDWNMQQIGESVVRSNIARDACNAPHNNYGYDPQSVLSAWLVDVDAQTRN